jgi:hypothetical protein
MKRKISSAPPSGRCKRPFGVEVGDEGGMKRGKKSGCGFVVNMQTQAYEKSGLSDLGFSHQPAAVL